MKQLSRRLLWLVLLLQLLVMLLVFFSVAMPLAKRSASDLAGLTIERGVLPNIDEAWKPHWYADWVEQALIAQGEHPSQVHIQQGIVEALLLIEDEPIVLRSPSPRLGWIFGLFFGVSLLTMSGTALALWWQGRWQRQMLRQQIMLSGLAHDLRTPLTRLQLQLALLPQIDASEQKLFSEQIQRMSEQIETALLLAQGEQNRPLPQQTMAQMWQSWQVSFPSVNFVCESDPLLNLTVPKLLERVVQNLIVNAQVHGQGQVSASLNQQHNGWKLSVTDEGEGVPEAVWKAVKAYQRPQSQGVGLGLLSSLWLAELMALRLMPGKGGMSITPLP